MKVVLKSTRKYLPFFSRILVRVTYGAGLPVGAGLLGYLNLGFNLYLTSDISQ